MDCALRLKAAQRKQSLNSIVLDEFTRALGGRTVKADFSGLVGKWVPDPGFDEVVSAPRQIEPENWE